jgi:hypothetical protein
MLAGQKLEKENEDDAQEGSHGRVDRGGAGAGGSGGRGWRRLAARWGSARRPTISGNGNTLGVGVIELRELRQLREENGRLNGWERI